MGDDVGGGALIKSVSRLGHPSSANESTGVVAVEPLISELSGGAEPSVYIYWLGSLLNMPCTALSGLLSTLRERDCTKSGCEEVWAPCYACHGKAQ